MENETREAKLAEIRARHHDELSAVYGSTNHDDWPIDIADDDPRIPQLEPIWEKLNKEIDELDS